VSSGQGDAGRNRSSVAGCRRSSAGCRVCSAGRGIRLAGDSIELAGLAHRLVIWTSAGNVFICGRNGKAERFSLRKGRGKMVAVENAESVLLTTKQAAKLLTIGERTLWRLSRSGIVPAPIRIGGAVRYRREELLEYIANLANIRRRR
jgi:excisionase family DNA binding protein